MDHNFLSVSGGLLARLALVDAPEAFSFSRLGIALALIRAMLTPIGEILAMIRDPLSLVSGAVALVGHPIPSR